MKRRINRWGAIVLALAGAGALGCGPDASSDASSVKGAGDEAGDDSGGGGGTVGDRDACKLENAQIGQVGVSVDLGSFSVVVDAWVAKDGEPDEYIGFTFHTTADASVVYSVKAGGETYPGQGTTWMHPKGTGGPEVSAISNIDFCDSCDDPDGCGTDDGAGGDGEPCDNPDGCDPGTGDGGGDGGSTPPPGGSCQTGSDCATGELCENGTCVPGIG